MASSMPAGGLGYGRTPLVSTQKQVLILVMFFFLQSWNIIFFSLEKIKLILFSQVTVYYSVLITEYMITEYAKQILFPCQFMYASWLGKQLSIYPNVCSISHISGWL